MKVLVTGAGGFLGRHLVTRLRARGHAVRALVRRPDSASWGGDPEVETVVADLRGAPLAPVLEGVDGVVHAAAATVGDDVTIFSGTVKGTERLFDAIGRSAVRRLVLVSSFSVYDWLRVGESLDRDSPLLEDPWTNGGYSAAKIWQERLAHRLAAASGIALTVLRPGFIWSPDGAMPDCLGLRFGSFFFVVGPRRIPPLTHVVNCADSIAAALESPAAAGRTFNIVDPGGVSAWRWVGARPALSGGLRRFPVPGLLARAAVAAIGAASRILFGSEGRLPSVCRPLRYALCFGRVRVDHRPLERELDWTPPLASLSEQLAAPGLPPPARGSPAAGRPVLAYFTGLYARATDTFIRNEVRHLRALGYRVHTFSPSRAKESQWIDEEIRAEQRATTYLLDQGLPALVLALLASLIRSPAATIGVARLAWDMSSPGLVARLRHFAYLCEAAFLAGELRARGVQHLHNHFAEASAVVAMLAARFAGMSWSQTVHGPYEFLRGERWRLGDKISSAAFTACISEFCRSQCMIFAPPSAWERLHLVRCGVADAFLAERPLQVPDVARFVCVGRLCAEKGQIMLVDAAARLAARWPELEILLIGDGPMRGAIEKRIADLGVARHVRVAGWQGSARVRAEVLGARAVVLPTFAEGLPVVLMEAFALGRPVVSTWVAGIPELVEQGVSGWLVAPGSLEALVRALEAALTSPVDRLTEMGRAGAARVAENHDPAREAAKLAALVDATASRRPGAKASR